MRVCDDGSINARSWEQSQKATTTTQHGGIQEFDCPDSWNSLGACKARDPRVRMPLKMVTKPSKNAGKVTARNYLVRKHYKWKLALNAHQRQRQRDSEGNNINRNFTICTPQSKILIQLLEINIVQFDLSRMRFQKYPRLERTTTAMNQVS